MLAPELEGLADQVEFDSPVAGVGQQLRGIAFGDDLATIPPIWPPIWD